MVKVKFPQRIYIFDHCKSIKEKVKTKQRLQKKGLHFNLQIVPIFKVF